MKKIGYLGGTFDPIHIGHLMLAEWALDAVDLEEIWIITTGQSYMKTEHNVLPAAERLHMAELAVAGNDRLKCLDIEVRRQGNTYTYETLEEMKIRYPDTDFYFIQGADCLFALDSWKYPGRILNSCTVLTAVRGDTDLNLLESKRRELLDKYNGNIVLMPFMQLSMSSSEIRERVRAGKSIRYMVPDRVLDYIEKKGFYCEETR